MSEKPMTAAEIKKALLQCNVQQSGLARDLGVAPSIISQVISGRTVSYRVQCHIAKAIGKPVSQVFLLKADPTKKGRPLGQGILGRREGMTGVAAASRG